MKTRLIIHIDRDLIEQAKAYAKRRGRSVSAVVAEYFESLTKESPRTPPLPTRQLDSLVGILKDAKIEESDYKKYLEKKYL